MLFVLIFAIRFLANTIYVEMFQALEFTCSVPYVFFWQFFSYSQYKTNVKKKAKGQVSSGVARILGGGHSDDTIVGASKGMPPEILRVLLSKNT